MLHRMLLNECSLLFKCLVIHHVTFSSLPVLMVVSVLQNYKPDIITSIGW